MSKIVTYSGKLVDLARPSSDVICIKDIAKHLSQINRFTGATNRPYSVAAHSVYVSEIVDAEFAFAGLMHDASEAYLADISAPLKSILPGYRSLEGQMSRIISLKYKVTGMHSGLVKRADMQAYVKERRTLITASRIEDDPDWDVFSQVREPTRALPMWDAEQAEWEFLKRFELLTGTSVLND